MIEKPRILLLDDEEIIRDLFSKLFSRDGRFHLDTVADGNEGLRALTEATYDLVITDLQMPNLAGIPFIRKLKQKYPNLPFMVFTGFGEVEDAIEALRLGALNFFRKPSDLDEMLPAVEKALALIALADHKQRVYNRLDRALFEFSLPPRISEKDPIIQHLVDPLVPYGIATEMEVKNIYLALDEALNNAIAYGALSIDSSIRDESTGHRLFQSLLEERERDPNYANRLVRIEATYTPDRVVFRIKDPGEGFDYKNLPDPTDPENLLREHGRGLLLMQCFMDKVEFNGKGNEVTLIRQRHSGN